MKKFQLTRAAILVMSALPLMAVGADEPAKTGEVVVTASRVAQGLQDVPMSVSVVTADEVKTTAKGTIGDLLEDVPGVQINNDGSTGLKRLSIRGENSFRSVVLVDGQRISEHKSMSGTAILVDPSEVERIEVIKGPASVLYGSDAIGGVINVITKKGGDKPFGAEVSVGYEGAGRGLSESAAVYGNVNGWKYRLSGGYQSHGNVDTPKGRMDSSSFRQSNINGFLSYDITPDTVVGLKFEHFDSDIESGTINDGYKRNRDEFYVDVPEWKRDKVALFAEARNVNQYLAKARWDGFWQKTSKEMTNHVGQTVAMSSAMTATHTMNNTAKNKTTTIGSSFQFDWQLGERNYLVTGWEFSEDELKANTGVDFTMDMTVKTPRMTMSMPGVAKYTTDRYNKGTQTTNALFAAMETQLPWDLTANYGVRYTYVKSKMTDARTSKNGLSVDMTTRRTIIYDNLDDGSAGSTGRTHNDRFVFNAGLIWKGIENLAVRANWAQGFRVPIMQEQYLMTSMGSTHGSTYGNPDLKPERSNNFEFGVRYDNGLFMTDAAVFFNKATNYITTRAINRYDSMYVNAAKADSWGLEVASSLKIGHFEPYVSATVMRRKLKFDSYETYASGSPEAWGRLGVRTNWDLYGGKLKGDAYMRAQTKTEAYSSAMGGKYRAAPGFATANMAASYTWGKDDRFIVAGEFLNIFNKSYYYSSAIYEPGRHFNVKFTAKY